MNEEQATQIRSGQGFFAALDQSGGSTPKALEAYGIAPSEYSDDAEMFDLVHAMRTRIITSSGFDGSKVLAAILFEDTIDRSIDGQDTAGYLWERKHVVPILKIDKGLAPTADGVQEMQEITGVDELLGRAVDKGIFGTKMRSFVQHADPAGITQVVEQQFAYASRVLAHGLVPILEPEVDIHAPDKAGAEQLLKASIREGLDGIPVGVQVMLKLSIPTEPGFYSDLIAHPSVMRVVALSGGYSRAEADALLRQNPGLIASFSRALTEGLSAQQSNAEFDAQLRASIDEIYRASTS